MSVIPESPEKRFYERNAFAHPADLSSASVEARWQQLHTPGDRYYCVFNVLKQGRGLEAIEWGFGDVARCEALARFFRRYTAVDVAASTLVQAAGLSRAPSFSYEDVNLNDDLPFATESFDVSLAMMVIEHLFDPFHSFREIARTTRRGGYVFINLPLVTSIKNRLALLCGWLPTTSSKDWWESRQWDGGHLHLFTIRSIYDLAEDAGLRPLRFHAVGRKLWLKKLAPSLLCHEASFIFQKD
jgi:SAM-dependent methyltransferase